MKSQEPVEITPEDIDKTIFKAEDFYDMGPDPWKSVKTNSLGGKKHDTIN